MFHLKIDGSTACNIDYQLCKKLCLLVPILLLLLNLITVVETRAVTRTTQKSNTSHYSWDIATDNPAVYEILPMLDLESLFADLTETSDNSANARIRRGLYASNYGKHIHKKVEAFQTQNRPFSAAVRVSNKCTGSLISHRHVLTAAHCVHNRKRPNYKLPLLKVGFLQRSGKFHWIKVTKMFIPDGWKDLKSSKDKSSKKYILHSDFAVLRLKRPHGRSYFTPAKGSYYSRSPMMFNGFPAVKGGTSMWHSSCRVGTVTIKGVILSTCTASEGSSGSGLYQARNKGGYAVTGIVSARLKIQNNKHERSFTVAIKLNSDKLKQICEWTRLCKY